MDGKNKVLLGGLVAYAGILFLKYKQAPITLKFFQYSLKGLKFKLSKTLVPEVIVSIEIFNPNRGAVPVTDFFGTISSKGVVLANFRNTEPVNINGSEQSTITVSAKISAAALVMKIINGSLTGVLDIDAVIKSNFFTMPIKKQFDLKTGTISGFKRIRQNLKQAHTQIFHKKRFIKNSQSTQN